MAGHPTFAIPTSCCCSVRASISVLLATQPPGFSTVSSTARCSTLSESKSCKQLDHPIRPDWTKDLGNWQPGTFPCLWAWIEDCPSIARQTKIEMSAGCRRSRRPVHELVEDPVTVPAAPHDAAGATGNVS